MALTSSPKVVHRVFREDGKGPSGNLSVAGEHLHRYMWGIGLLPGVGGVAVHGEDAQRRHPAVALSYGVGGSSLAGRYFAALPLIRALRRRARVSSA